MRHVNQDNQELYLDQPIRETILAPRGAAENWLGLLRERSQEAGLTLTPLQLEQFALFAQLLVAGNARMNLTTITKPDDIVCLHFLDSVGVWSQLEPAHLGLSVSGLRLADIGTGAGFPGIPLKILIPGLNLTLIDGTRKKIRFLEHVVHSLSLQGARAIHGRAEELAHTTEHRAAYDVVVARGLAPWVTLLEYVLPFVREGGLCLVYKGPGFAAELSIGQTALTILQAEVEQIIPVSLPGRDVQRLVAVVRKTGRTPRRYPRAQGLPRRQPLQAR